MWSCISTQDTTVIWNSYKKQLNLCANSYQTPLYPNKNQRLPWKTFSLTIFWDKYRFSIILNGYRALHSWHPFWEHLLIWWVSREPPPVGWAPLGKAPSLDRRPLAPDQSGFWWPADASQTYREKSYVTLYYSIKRIQLNFDYNTPFHWLKKFNYFVYLVLHTSK